MVKMLPMWAVSVAVSADVSTQTRYCCGDAVPDCSAPKNTKFDEVPLEHWCLDTIEMKQVRSVEEIQPNETKKSLYHCLAGCELDFRCYFATCENCDQHNGERCIWYGSGDNNYNQLAWMLLQTDDTSDVPKPFKEGNRYDKVHLGPGPATSFTQCKEWWVSAFRDGTIDQNIGEFTGKNRFFTFADVQTGKGNVRVKARYVETSPENGSAALHNSVSCNGNLLVYTDKTVDTDKTVVKLQPQTEATNYVWKLSGRGMFPADRGGQCLTVQDSNSDNKKNDQKAAVGDFFPDVLRSKCVSFDTPSSDAAWISSVEDWGQAANYGMGECDPTAESLQMWHLKRDQAQLKTCGGKACGHFKFSLVGDDEHPDSGLEHGEVVSTTDSYNCFGFKSTTTTTTTTTTTRTTTIQYCVDIPGDINRILIGQCPGARWETVNGPDDSVYICWVTDKVPAQFKYCLTFDHSLRLEQKDFAPDRHTTQQWRVMQNGKIFNIGSQMCLAFKGSLHPGATIPEALPCDFPGATFLELNGDALTVPLQPGDVHKVIAGVSHLATASSQAAVGTEESCPAAFPGVSALCMAGTTCCGRNTLTPECYFEEYNSCCQPEASSISILCAKDQGCASIDGLPTCVPAGNNDACSCAQDLGHTGSEGNYYCKPSHSTMCYHAPDRKSCQDTYGQDASFCYVSPAGTITLI